jgi:hypothetical protein
VKIYASLCMLSGIQPVSERLYLKAPEGLLVCPPAEPLLQSSRSSRRFILACWKIADLTLFAYACHAGSNLDGRYPDWVSGPQYPAIYFVQGPSLQMPLARTCTLSWWHTGLNDLAARDVRFTLQG